MQSDGEKWLTMYTHINAHLEHCRARGLAKETTIPARFDLLERIQRAFGDLHTVTTSQLETWLAGPPGRRPCDDWSPKTRATYHAHLRAYYRWAQRAGLVAVNPMDLIDPPKVPYQKPRNISPAVFTRIRRHAVEPYLTAAMLARYAGLRCCEVSRAHRDDIDAGPPLGQIRVLGKGGRIDEIPTHAEIWRHVRGRRGLLVRDTHGQQYRPSTLSNMFASYCRDKLDLDITMHDLRRLYGNTLRQVRDVNGNAIDLEVIRGLMRHRSLDTTQRYLSAGDEERRNAIQALPTVA